MGAETDCDGAVAEVAGNGAVTLIPLAVCQVLPFSDNDVSVHHANRMLAARAAE